ncbi:MAG TPA: hypothetical protein VMX36_01400 [Sedimentisphaerales bacterium]|nr:hypothetical protein [Sedimentisphaerales bacterium]
MYNIEGGLWILNHSREVKDLSVLEYGDQTFWVHAKPILKTERDVARDWYVDRGVKEYVSMDTNGCNGALPFDLTEPIPQDYWNRFDVVTNIGTTEHFSNDNKSQWQAFCNTVRACKVGGIILHNIPPENMWLDHCAIWYRDGLGAALAMHTGCELIIEERLQLVSLNPAADYLCIALRKTHEVEFDVVPPAEFVERLAR